MACIWRVFGVYLASIWRLFGVYLACIRLEAYDLNQLGGF